MEKELLKQIIAEQRNDFLKKPTGIARDRLSEAEQYLKLPHVYVISGIRRCGKSTLMRQIAAAFYPDNDFFFLNFEDERLFNFDVAEFNRLLELQIEMFGPHKTFFIDEIQNVAHFELFLRRLSDSGYKFIVTGSNAGLLGGELSTKITGRHVITQLQPFSFREFLKFHNTTFTPEDFYLTENRAILSAVFEKYFFDGGMPEYLIYKTAEILNRMYEDILIKDIAVRHGITNVVSLRELSRYLISNFGRRYSYNSLRKATGLGSVNTAINYTAYLEQGFLIRNLNKFDYSLKVQQSGEKKVYVTDHAIMRQVSTTLMKDTGRILENIVANALLADHQVYYFAGKNECDFVAVDKHQNVRLFQVCADLNNQNISRETAGLIEAMNYFNIGEGTILTSGQEDELTMDDKTITVIPLWKWLLINL
jgi:uncharacterized protein